MEFHLIVHAGSCNFSNDFALNVVSFGVNNDSSSDADNRKNSFLVLGEGPTYDINGSFASPEKRFSIYFSKANKKFCLNRHDIGHYSYLFANNILNPYNCLIKNANFSLKTSNE